MEVIILGAIATILTQVSKRSGFTGRQLAVLVSLALALTYFIVQMLISEATLTSIIENFVKIWGSSTIIYDYIVKTVLNSGK